jgi:hypothetical protein
VIFVDGVYSGSPRTTAEDEKIDWSTWWRTIASSRFSVAATLLRQLFFYNASLVTAGVCLVFDKIG